jgi:hypothetical protein
LIVAAVVVVNNVLAVATGSPPSTCSLSLAIGVNETHKARCNIRCVQISHSDIAKRRRNESFSPGGDDHIPFLSLSCAGIRLCTATIKMGCTFLCVPFRFFRTQPPRFLPLPYSSSRDEDAVFGMLNFLILCRGRTVHFPESTRKINIKRKKREIRSLEKGTHSCTDTHTHKTQMLLHADNTFLSSRQ